MASAKDMLYRSRQSEGFSSASPFLKKGQLVSVRARPTTQFTPSTSLSMSILVLLRLLIPPSTSHLLSTVFVHATPKIDVLLTRPRIGLLLPLQRKHEVTMDSS